MGTGSEDYFTDAWGLHVDERPVRRRHGRRRHGARLAHDGIPLALLGPDPVHEVAPSSTSSTSAGRSTRTARSSPPSACATTSCPRSSFWYQDGIATGLPPVPYGSARLPQGNARQFEVETVMDAIAAEKGKAGARRGPLLVEGRRRLPGARDRARSSRSRSTSPRPATTSSTRRSRRARTTASTRCCSTASRRSRRSSSTSRARTCGRSSRSTATRTRRTSAWTTRSAGRG